MLWTVLAFAVAVLPILSVAALLEMAAWRERRRQAAIGRQIALTDAIAHELGAVVAPVVKKRLLGPWEVRIAVPFTRPTTVGTVLSIAHRVLSIAERRAGRYQIVLTPQEGAPRREAGVAACASPLMNTPPFVGARS